MKHLFLVVLGLLSFSLRTDAVCGMASGITLISTTDFSANLSWTPVPGATFYSLRYRVAAGPGPWIISSSTPANKLIVGLTGGTTYDFQINTYCASGNSGFTASFQFTTQNNCTPPTGQWTDVVGPTKVYCYWDPVPAANWYTMQHRVAAGPGPWTTGTVTGTVKGLKFLIPHTVYDYRVAVNCTGGQGAYSPIYQFQTDCATLSAIPTPGTYFETHIQNDGDTTAYADSTDCGGIAIIIDSLGGNVMGSTTVSTTIGTTIQTGMDPYYLFGNRSITITPTSDGPDSVFLFFHQSDFDLYNANNPAYLDLPVSGSNLDPNIPNMRLAKVAGGITTYFAPTLVWVDTANTWVASFKTTSVSGTYYFFTMPDCVGVNVNGLAITNVTGSTVTPTWLPVTYPAWGWYTVRWGVAGSGIWLSGTANNPATSKFINGLTPNTTYELQIRRNCSNQSAGNWSTAQTFTTLNTCLTPTNVNMTNITGTSAKINWTASTGAAFYTTRYRLAAGPGPWINGTVSSTFRNISGLTPGTTYDVEVGTNCSGYLSPFSPTIQFTTAAAKPSGVNDALAEGDEISIYPNPAHEVLNINLTMSKSQSVNMKLTDMSGRIVKQISAEGAAGENLLNMDIRDIAKGIYTLQVYYQGQLSFVSQVMKD